MARLSPEKRAAVVRCLVEGVSIRATVRLTGAAKTTVARLLVKTRRRVPKAKTTHSGTSVGSPD